MKNIPEIGQIVKFKDKEFKVLSCDKGGKCKIKKTLLPNKGRVLNDIDISELS
jgi:hypothetical protein